MNIISGASECLWFHILFVYTHAGMYDQSELDGRRISVIYDRAN